MLAAQAKPAPAQPNGFEFSTPQSHHQDNLKQAPGAPEQAEATSKLASEPIL
jgi:hypothetical protein